MVLTSIGNKEIKPAQPERKDDSLLVARQQQANREKHVGEPGHTISHNHVGRVQFSGDRRRLCVCIRVLFLGRSPTGTLAKCVDSLLRLTMSKVHVGEGKGSLDLHGLEKVFVLGRNKRRGMQRGRTGDRRTVMHEHTHKVLDAAICN